MSSRRKTSRKRYCSDVNYGIVIKEDRLQSFNVVYPEFRKMSIVEYKTGGKMFLLSRCGIMEGKRAYRLYPISGCIYFQGKLTRAYRLAVLVRDRKYIPPTKEIHHINHNHNDNRCSNLLIVSHKQHEFLHKTLRKAITEKVNNRTDSTFEFYSKLVEKMQYYSCLY